MPKALLLKEHTHGGTTYPVDSVIDVRPDQMKRLITQEIAVPETMGEADTVTDDLPAVQE